jgi:pSer/pThr/pTyr-binding forkhead associated (FHA) protein
MSSSVPSDMSETTSQFPSSTETTVSNSIAPPPSGVDDHASNMAIIENGMDSHSLKSSTTNPDSSNTSSTSTSTLSSSSLSSSSLSSSSRESKSSSSHSSHSRAASNPFDFSFLPKVDYFYRNLPVWCVNPRSASDNLYCEWYLQDGVIIGTKRLYEHRAYVVGRDKERCQLLVTEHGISREHCAILHTKIGPVIVDLHSTQGTFINNHLLKPGIPYKLYEHDLMKLGTVSTLYRFKNTGNDKRTDPTARLETLVSSSSSSSSSHRSSHGHYNKDNKDKDASSNSSNRYENKDKDKDKESTVSSSNSGSSSSYAHKRRQDSSSDSLRSHDSSRKSQRRDEDKIRCYHILVKHSKSRNPSSWLSPNITRSLDEAKSSIQNYHSRLTEARNKALASNNLPTTHPWGQDPHTVREALEREFKQMASSLSDCSSAKYQGDLGYFQYDKMQPPFSKASFALKVGELSNIVETDSGVHIIFRKD